MRKPDNVPESGPVIVGVDGSERSVEALALADLLGPVLERRVVIAYVHPYGRFSSLFSEGAYGTLVREVAESTFDQIREHLPSVRSDGRNSSPRNRRRQGFMHSGSGRRRG
jgi:hypothetical protein